MRERELKPGSGAGASLAARVAPHAGARIETPDWHLAHCFAWSLPMRERELKLAAYPQGARGWLSLPMRERELKLHLRIMRGNAVRRSPCGSAN